MTFILILNGVLFDPTYDPPDVVIQSSIVVSKRSPLVVTKRPTPTATMDTPTSLPRSRTSIASGMLFQHGIGRGNTSVEFSVAQAMKMCGFTETECKSLSIRKIVLRARDTYRTHPPNGRTNKSGYSATFIAGSNFSGWPLPGHLKMKSDAKNKNKNKKIDKKLFAHAMRSAGAFGNNEMIERDITINCNENYGMDNEQFSKYIQTQIMPLYPDARDVIGKRVLLIVDSGPGQLNGDLLDIL